MIAFARVDFPEPLGPIRAWISPLSTVNSTPRRISFSPARTWRFRISSSAISSFQFGWLYDCDADAESAAGYGFATAGELDQFGQRRGLQGADDPALDSCPQELGRAAPPGVWLMRAQHTLGVVVDEALHRRNRAFERLHHLVHRDLLRRSGQPISAVRATGAHHQPGFAQPGDHLLEVGQRQPFSVRDRLQARGMLRRLPAQLDHQAHAVLGLGGEDHRAKSYQGGRLSGNTPEAPVERGAIFVLGGRLRGPSFGSPIHVGSCHMDVGRLASTAGIVEAAEAARGAGRLGIDTEFMSEGRYRALLCLVQVAVDNPDPEGLPLIVLIDSLSAPDLSSIAGLLADPSIEVVLHAGRQDVAILRRAWGTELTNIFDTQIAAGFAGASAQAGYGNLIGSMLGLRVGKTASYTLWFTRPPTAEQLSYAAEDVAHLLQLSDELQQRLRSTGRLEWAREECHRLQSATDERDPYAVWQRLPRMGQLDPTARAVARELAAWRERTASDQDRPVGSVLADPALVELAKRQPSSVRALEQIRGLHPSSIKRRGPAILAAIAEGLTAPPIPRDEARGRSEPGDAPLIALAEALLRARALEAGLAYELIASRAELELIVGAARRSEPEPEVRTLTGWREELVGSDLRDLLAGRRSVLVGPDRRLELGSPV